MRRIPSFGDEQTSRGLVLALRALAATSGARSLVDASARLAACHGASGAR